MTQLKTALVAFLLAVASAASSVAQIAPAGAAAEKPGCQAYLVYPPATTAVDASQSLSCEAQGDVRLHERAARTDETLQEHASSLVDANLEAVGVP